MSEERTRTRFENPNKIIDSAVNGNILIRLKDGSEYDGQLEMIDGYMNMILNDVTEIEDGQPKAKYNKIFIRGNNLLFIKPTKEEKFGIL